MAENNAGKDAELKAHEADKDAVAAREKEADAKKTPERREAEKAENDAAKAHADAAAAQADEGERGPSTVAEAGIVGVYDQDMLASDPRAVKRDNDPANPAHAPHLAETEERVRLTRRTPDVDGLVTADVHPGMVGDYLRAGWEK